jgi:NADPH-dependent 2,4-dienoyl-CoA reductase/sulfur reductase-like enzyme
LLILRDTFTRRRISSIRGCYIEYKPDGIGRHTEAMASPSIIIVGAGLAGLAAARILQRRGCVVAVFEARERIGAAYGRAATASAACMAKPAAS